MGVKRLHLDWATPRVPAYRAARKAGIPHLADFLWTQWKQFYAEFPEEVDVRSLEGHMQSRVKGMQVRRSELFDLFYPYHNDRCWIRSCRWLASDPTFVTHRMSH